MIPNRVDGGARSAFDPAFEARRRQEELRRLEAELRRIQRELEEARRRAEQARQQSELQAARTTLQGLQERLQQLSGEASRLPSQGQRNAGHEAARLRNLKEEIASETGIVKTRVSNRTDDGPKRIIDANGPLSFGAGW